MITDKEKQIEWARIELEEEIMEITGQFPVNFTRVGDAIDELIRVCCDED